MRVEDSYKVDGYYPTIGIECHVQLKTKSKLFGTEGNDARDAEPNTLVGHVSYGLPGALPVLNEEAIRLASKAAFALETTPQKYSKFDRKHYFYPDLPFGYQITQFDQPIILGGRVEIILEDGSSKVINVTRAHIEADAGKSTHPAGKDYSLVDLNRAGTPLLEIVSEPEMHNAQEARAYAKELWLRMKYADVSDVDLYHGNMRFDVNVSVSKDPEQFGTRTETKNLNSFKSVERAVEYEIKRQIKELEKGGTIVQETRGWLDDSQKTVSQRSKEDAHDYRYFPDPDIPPVELDDKFIKGVKDTMQTSPREWRKKLSQHGFKQQTIETLLEFQVEAPTDFLYLIEDADNNQAKKYANWVINIEVPFIRENPGIRVSRETREIAYSETYKLLENGKLSSNGVENLIIKLLQAETPCDDVEAVAKKEGLIQMSDSGELEVIVQKVIDDNPKAVEEIKSGQIKVIGFLVGQVMNESKGQANPGMAQKIIKEKLGV
jgi:aspartyl-tRNA(Asn)/glutamyl-tRNA(Gln) amidotransferase subunit B